MPLYILKLISLTEDPNAEVKFGIRVFYFIGPNVI